MLDQEDNDGMALLPLHSKHVTDGAISRPKGFCALVVIFLLTLWYTFSAIVLLLNKYILSTLNGDPTVLGNTIFCTLVTNQWRRHDFF